VLQCGAVWCNVIWCGVVCCKVILLPFCVHETNDSEADMEEYLNSHWERG